MSNLLEQLPPFYCGIREFREMSKVVTPEYEKVDAAFQQIEDDLFILTSSEEAVIRREKMFGIVADPQNEDLQFRRLRLLTRKQSNPPYTLEYLKKILTSMVGENNHSVFEDIQNFELEVSVQADKSSYYTEVQNILERIVPYHIDITTSVNLITEYLKLIGKAYTFPVNYRVTNRFGTAQVPGAKAEVPLLFTANSYDVDVNYRICGRFRTGGR